MGKSLQQCLPSGGQTMDWLPSSQASLTSNQLQQGRGQILEWCQNSKWNGMLQIGYHSGIYKNLLGNGTANKSWKGEKRPLKGTKKDTKGPGWREKNKRNHDWEAYFTAVSWLATLGSGSQFSSFQLLSCVWPFATARTAAHQVSLSITNSRSLLKLMSIKSVMPSNHLSSPSPPTFSNSQSQSLFQWVRFSHQVAKVLAFQLQHQSFQWISGLISFRIDWVDLREFQGTLKCLLQHQSSKASILQRSTFFIVQLSHPYKTIRKTIALTRWTFVGKVMSLLSNVLSRLVIAFLSRSKCL